MSTGGTANLFMLFAPLEGWRHVEVTDQRTAADFARILKELSDTHFPNAPKIVLVQDNLNTHKPASLYEAFPAVEARRLVERCEWHFLGAADGRRSGGGSGRGGQNSHVRTTSRTDGSPSVSGTSPASDG